MEKEKITKIPLVFIHGIKGSVLADSPSGYVHWLNGFQALNLYTPKLALPITWNDQGQDRDSLKPTAILCKILHFFKIYDPWLQTAKKLDRPFYQFPYDWRRDNHENASQFEEFLMNVSKENGNAQVQVVAHSMGGLITLAVLNRKTDLFHSVLFAGVPFNQGISFLRDLHVGSPTGLNHKLLAPEVLYTFPSTYTFFPFKENHKFFDENSQPIEIDLFNVGDWVKHKLGIFAHVEPTEEMQKHVSKCLEISKNFRSLLVYSESVKYPPIASLMSKSHPTMHHIMVNGPKSIRNLDFDSMPTMEGDNRVTIEGAQLPNGIPHEVFETKLGHGDLLNDPIVPEILEKLLNKER